MKQRDELHYLKKKINLTAQWTALGITGILVGIGFLIWHFIISNTPQYVLTIAIICLVLFGLIFLLSFQRLKKLKNKARFLLSR